MYDTLHGARQSTGIVNWWRELHHTLAPHLNHKLAPTLEPLLVLGVGHVRFKSSLTAHN